MAQLKLLALGGMGSVTQNMFVYEYENEMLLVDCGIGFPDQYMPGVDIIIPDIAYVQKQVQAGKTIVGMILTHGHDDHIGATPYLLPHLPAFPVFGSPLTMGFTKDRLSEAAVAPELRVVRERTQFSISRHFHATAYRVTHSVPDTMHYVIQTPVGLIYHGSDFKLDPTPVDHKPSDLEGIGALRGQIKLMMMDCLRVETAQPVPSESSVEAHFDRLMELTRGKCIVTLMSSHIHRIQQVVNAAKKHQRQVAFIGRSVEQNVQVAQDLGILQIDPKMLIDKRKTEDYPDSQLCLIVAGSQGQEGSSLVRAAFGEHPVLQIKPTDTVIFSADAIPGNELNYYGAIDEMCRNGVHVLYPSIEAGLHESGHASRQEQSEMLNLVKPEFIMPIGGSDRHRFKFRELVAQPAGYGRDHILLPSTGQVLGIDQGGIRVVEEVVLKPTVVDGLGIGDVGPMVLSDRRSMGQAGMIVVVVPSASGQLDLKNIQVVSRGFVFMKDAGEVIGFIKKTVAETVSDNQGVKHDELRRTIEKKLARKLYKIIRREPLIMVVMMQV